MNDDSKIDGLPDSGGTASPATVERALGDFGSHLDSLIDERVEDSLFLTPTSSGRSSSVGHARTRVRPRLASIAAVAAAFFVVASVVSLLTSDSTNEWASPVQPVDPPGALYMLPDPGLGLELSGKWVLDVEEFLRQNGLEGELVFMTVGRRMDTPLELGMSVGSTTFGQIATIYTRVGRFSPEDEAGGLSVWTELDMEGGAAWISNDHGTSIIQQRGEFVLRVTTGEAQSSYVRDLVESIEVEDGQPILYADRLDLVVLKPAQVSSGVGLETLYWVTAKHSGVLVAVSTGFGDSLFDIAPSQPGMTLTKDDETQRWIGRYEDEAGAASYAVMWRETPNRVVVISGPDYLNEADYVNRSGDLDYLNEIADSLTQVDEEEWLEAFDS